MNSQDGVKFNHLLAMIGEVHDMQFTKLKINAWWCCLQKFTISQVENAVMLHLQDADEGQYKPKPAMIIKHIVGTRKSNAEDLESIAAMQFSNVLRAITECGSYRTPNFKDAITRAVVSNFGWRNLCELTSDQLIWKQKEFINSYQDYSTKPINQLPHHIAGRQDLMALKNAKTDTLQGLLDQASNRLGVTQ